MYASDTMRIYDAAGFELAAGFSASGNKQTPKPAHWFGADTLRKRNRDLYKKRQGKCLRNPKLVCIDCGIHLQECSLARRVAPLAEGSCCACGKVTIVTGEDLCLTCLNTYVKTGMPLSIKQAAPEIESD